MQTPLSGTSDHRPPPAPADQQLSERPGIQPDFYDVRQYSRLGVLAVWAAAALPMAALAWLVAPAVTGTPPPSASSRLPCWLR